MKAPKLTKEEKKVLSPIIQDLTEKIKKLAYLEPEMGKTIDLQYRIGEEINAVLAEAMAKVRAACVREFNRKCDSELPMLVQFQRDKLVEALENAEVRA